MKVFLSHSNADKEIVEPIGSWLSWMWLEIWLDNWSMTPGDSLIEKISDGIESSDKLVVFLSPNSVDSNWVKKEVATGLILELWEEKWLGEKFVIPVLLKTCKVPLMLREKIYANFTNKAFETWCKELLMGITNTPSWPLDKKLENRNFRFWKVPPKWNGKYWLIIEFWVKISPTQGVHIGIDVGANYIEHCEWFWIPHPYPTAPTISWGGGVWTMSSSRIEPPIFARKFETPNITSTKSLFIYFESNEDFNIQNGNIKFLDYYDQIP